MALLGSDVPIARGAPVAVGIADERAPRMAAEARAVAAALGKRARLLQGREATFDALRALRNPSCLHVAAHGRFRPDQPAMSAMQLGDGWLRAVEWPALQLRGSLVVLSGCDTGITGAHGAELAGLVRGVLAAGAADVVTGLFALPDAPTEHLMERFHAARVRHRDPAAALASVQATAARRGEPVWQWCGFSAWTRRLRAR